MNRVPASESKDLSERAICNIICWQPFCGTAVGFHLTLALSDLQKLWLRSAESLWVFWLKRVSINIYHSSPKENFDASQGFFTSLSNDTVITPEPKQGRNVQQGTLAWLTPRLPTRQVLIPKPGIFDSASSVTWLSYTTILSFYLFISLFNCQYSFS